MCGISHLLLSSGRWAWARAPRSGGRSEPHNLTNDSVGDSAGAGRAGPGARNSRAPVPFPTTRRRAGTPIPSPGTPIPFPTTRRRALLRRRPPGQHARATRPPCRVRTSGPRGAQRCWERLWPEQWRVGGRPRGGCVVGRVSWPFYRTSSGVRLCWKLEEPKGPKGSVAPGCVSGPCGRGGDREWWGQPSGRAPPQGRGGLTPCEGGVEDVAIVEWRFGA